MTYALLDIDFCQRLLLFYSFIYIPNCRAQMFIILKADKKIKNKITVYSTLLETTILFKSIPEQKCYIGSR